MSRIGKNPVTIPSDVKVRLENSLIEVSGPKGLLKMPILPEVDCTVDEAAKSISFAIKDKSCRKSRSNWGTTKVLVNNMVQGVSQGFSKKLLISGVGYKAQASGSYIILSIGKSHDVCYQAPADVRVETPKPTEIIISGIDKQKVGEVAAKIKRLKPVEPYKNKGIYEEGAYIIKKTFTKK